MVHISQINIKIRGLVREKMKTTTGWNRGEPNSTLYINLADFTCMHGIGELITFILPSPPKYNIFNYFPEILLRLFFPNLTFQLTILGICLIMSRREPQTLFFVSSLLSFLTLHCPTPPPPFYRFLAWEKRLFNMSRPWTNELLRHQYLNVVFTCV